MKFSIERDVLVHLTTKACGTIRGKKGRQRLLQLSACAARVFVTGPAMTAGHEALVLSDGQCEVRALMFREIIKSYSAKQIFIIEVDEHGLRLEKSVLPVASFSRKASPPGNFQIFAVTDLHVLGKPTQP